MSWKSTLQHVVALSTIEAEYIALTEAIKEAIWIKVIINELGIKCSSVKLYCDSQSAIYLSKNTMFHERSKHIDVRLHFVRDIISRDIIRVEKISTLDNPVDIFTKPVPISKFEDALNLRVSQFFFTSNFRVKVEFVDQVSDSLKLLTCWLIVKRVT